MTDTYELPELPEVELPKLPPMTQEGYTILAMQMYAVEYAEQFAKIYARLAVKAERERAIAVVQAEIDRAEALMAVEENGAPVFDREQTDAGICALRIVAAAIRAG